MNVIISNKAYVDAIKQKMQAAGPDSMHVLADFDRTLTYASVNGVKTPSIVALLRDGTHLSHEYAKRAHALADKYYPIEKDVQIPLAKKKEAMQRWWTEHFNLMIQARLAKADLEKIVKSGKVKLRAGVAEFFEYSRAQGVPTVIISASGVGELLPMYMRHESIDDSLVAYVTNEFIWDEQGYATGFNEPVIHSMNKDETILKKLPSIYETISDRKNVILLGDTLSDVDMITGFDYENLLKIGFLNEKETEQIESYTNAYDIVITNDGDFTAVTELLKELVA